MAKLETLGISVPLGEARIRKIKERFPDLDVVVELDLDRLGESFANVDAMVGRGTHVKLLPAETRLRWIQTQTAGADGISLLELHERGILFTNGSGIHAPNLGEHMLALILAFARGLPTLLHRQSRRQWTEQLDSWEIEGQTLCVVGLGDIGLALSEKAAALGMRVTGVRRRDLPVPEFISAVATIETMNPLITEADHIALCLPATARTVNLFDADRLALLKPSAYIYNTGRGELIDQDALIAAIKEGRLAGAGLDVTTPEPLPEESELWELENVILTCHTGGRSPRRLDRFVDLLIDNIDRYRSDKPMRNVVDPVEGY